MLQDSFPRVQPDTLSLDSSFADSKIISIIDHMPHVNSIQLYVDDKERFFQNTIVELFDAANIDFREKIFVFDSYMCFDDFDLEQCIFTNDWLFNHPVQEFLKELPDWHTVPQTTPTKKLAAIMNKVRPNRLIASTILANMFELSDIDYSFSLIGTSCASIVIEEMLSKCSYDLDVTKLLPEKWAGPKLTTGTDAETFCKFLYDQVFSSAAISLITEPTFFENGAHLSEKTLMSVYSGHFPIWVGSYKAAECAERLGLDIFSDIIDHSYQYIEHPGKRSVEAVLRNIDLLTNLEMQIDLRNTMYKRFNDNLKLMRDLDKLRAVMREKFNSHNLDLYDYLTTDS